MDGGGRIVVHAVATARLEPDPIPAEQVLDGAPAASESPVASWADGTLTGVWRCEPGRFRDVEVAETFVVLAGRASIRHGEDLHEVAAGDVCVLPAGAETEWTVHETILKVYVLDPG